MADLPGLAYLYRLAVVSITFVGFSAVQGVCAIALVLEALRVLTAGPAVYALALTVVLITSGIAYLIALGVAFPSRA